MQSLQQVVEYTPHSDDITAKFLSVKSSKITQRQAALISSISNMTYDESLSATAKQNTFLTRFNAALKIIGLPMVSVRTMIRDRRALADLGIISFKKVMNEETTVTILLDGIKANLAQVWGTLITKARKRALKPGARSLRKAEAKLNRAVSRATECFKTKSSGAPLDPNRSNKRSKKISLDKNNQEKLTASDWTSLYNNSALPELVKKAMQWFKAKGKPFPFKQYDHKGRYQITGKAANEAIKKREDEEEAESRKYAKPDHKKHQEAPVVPETTCLTRSLDESTKKALDNQAKAAANRTSNEVSLSKIADFKRKFFQ